MTPNGPPLFAGLDPPASPSLVLEQKYLGQGYAPIAGVDEAGRGPLAGPVVAAAVVLPVHICEHSRLWKVRDSKMLSEAGRDELYQVIVAESEDAAWALCDPGEIDRLNILRASLEAMARAITALRVPPAVCLIDGRDRPPVRTPSVPVIKGDRHCLSIAAASIIAKVVRDRIMTELHRQYPVYGFNLHKGYPTPAHKRALADHGPCPVHRRSFRGVTP
jgi:ribonuclease HII